MSHALRLAAAAVVVAVSSACGDSPTSPRATPRVAEADAILQSLNQAGVVAAIATGGPSTAAALSSTPCSYADGRYDCPPVTNAGLTVTRSFAFYDAAGTPQRQYDPLTTASVLNSVALKGHSESPRGAIDFDRAFTQTASGLLGQETRRVVDGTGSGTTKVTSTAQGDTRTITATTHDTTRALVLPVIASGSAASSYYPLGGSVTMVTRYAVASTGSSPAPWPVPSPTRMTITFDGTSVARVDVSIGSATQRCTLNMAAGSSALSCPTPINPLQP